MRSTLGRFAFAAQICVLAACASIEPAARAPWAEFVGGFAGEPIESPQYPGGTTKVALAADVPASIDGGNARFSRWCAAHSGTSGPVQQLARSSAALANFQEGLAAKSNAEQASGLAFVSVSALACVDKGSDGLIALMVSAPGRRGETEVRDGKVLNVLTRAFFTAEQAARFGSIYQAREAERSRQAAVRLQEREAQKTEAMRRLRSNPRVGDRTTIGVIVDVRAPLALVQYDERYRALSNRPPAEWLPIESLLPESR